MHLFADLHMRIEQEHVIEDLPCCGKVRSSKFLRSFDHSDRKEGQAEQIADRLSEYLVLLVAVFGTPCQSTWYHLLGIWNCVSEYD